MEFNSGIIKYYVVCPKTMQTKSMITNTEMEVEVVVNEQHWNINRVYDTSSDLYNNSDIDLWCDERSKPHTTNDYVIETATTCTNHGNHNFSNLHDNNNNIFLNNRIYVTVGNNNADYIKVMLDTLLTIKKIKRQQL